MRELELCKTQERNRETKDITWELNNVIQEHKNLSEKCHLEVIFIACFELINTVWTKLLLIVSRA